MSKEQFLGQLRKGLSGLPQDDREERLAFYSEMLDDRFLPLLSSFFPFISRHGLSLCPCG